MSKYVLFSPIGSTDPIRDYYDGPMLHTVRHYKPWKVYLYYTKEMLKKRGKVEKVLEPFKIEIENIETDIDNPHDFDIYADTIEKILVEIQNANKDSKILLNISSGTPQLKSALALEVVASNLQLKPIQVLTPVGGSNENIPHDGTIGENFDDLMENGEYIGQNRCIEPNILSFRKMAVKRDIISLINSYEYRLALEKVKKNENLFNQKTLELIEYAMHRQNDNKTYRKMKWHNKFNFTKDTKAGTAADYYSILKNKGETGELSYFILLLKPLAEFIARNYLGEFEHREVERALDDYYIKNNKGRYTPHYVWKDKERQVTYNLEQYICIMEFKGKDREVIERFAKIQEHIEESRNFLAHELYRVEDIDYKEILRTIRYLIIKVFGNRLKHESLRLYEFINEEIEKIL